MCDHTLSLWEMDSRGMQNESPVALWEQLFHPSHMVRIGFLWRAKIRCTGIWNLVHFQHTVGRLGSLQHNTRGTVRKVFVLVSLAESRNSCPKKKKRERLFLLLLLFVFWFFETGFLCTGCPGTHFVYHGGLKLRNLAASVSWVLGLKVCATTPFNKEVPQRMVLKSQEKLRYSPG